MKRYYVLIMLGLTSCAAPRSDLAQFGPQSANPSAVFAAEIGFNRLAQDKGQWTAFRETAAKDAVMFVPEPVVAQNWLKGKANPAKSVTWQPHKVFMSCDGKTGVTSGAWQGPDKTVGYFTTIWQRFDKDEQPGKYYWILDHADILSGARNAPELIETRIASCKGRAPASLSAPPEGVTMKQGFAYDQSLSWNWQYRPDGSRTVSVSLWNGTGLDVVLVDQVGASAASPLTPSVPLPKP